VHPGLPFLFAQARALALVNRSFNAVIEATVQAIRYVRFRDPKLLELIEHCEGIVRRCGGKRELERWSF
jgi:hypothetical protein